MRVPSRARSIRPTLLLSLVTLAGCGGGGSDGGVDVDLLSFPRITLENHVTDPSRLTLVVLTGGLSGDEVKSHSHFRTDGSSVPLYAPIAMTLRRGSWSSVSNDHQLVFEINPRYWIILGHVTEPRADILAAIPRVDTVGWIDIAPIAFSAGEQIATSSGTTAVNGIDFGLYDLAVESVTANTPRYRAEMFWQKLHSVCPYDYFSDALRPSYEALYGSMGGASFPGFACRTFSDQYRDGSIAGEWFLTSHAPDGTYGQRFAIGTTLGDGNVRIVGIRGTFDVPGGTDPKTVTNEVCYESGGSYIYLRRTSPTTLDAVFGTGACPPSFPAGAHRSYAR